MIKRYPFENCMNMRDIGGYPLDSNRYVPYQRFLRSDAPVKLSTHEIKTLQELKISTVVDLRYSEEALRRPCALKGLEGYCYYNICIGSGGLPEKEEDIYLSYLEFTDKKVEMLQIFQIFADAPSGVLFHCTAGKDRTGVISAILLLLAGAEELDIVADYQVSYTYIKKLMCRLRKDNPDLPAFAGQSKPEYMEEFLHKFLLKYKSAEAYLSSIGMEKQKIDLLKGKLSTTFE